MTADPTAHTIDPDDLQCPACGAGAELVPSAEIYGRTYGGPRWRCANGCDAHVGCHPDTEAPLGTLATPAIREARQQAHRLLDRLWHSAGARRRVYAALADHLGVELEDCHIGMFDVEQCQQVVDWAISRSMQSG